MEKPALQSVGPAPRAGDALPGIGESKALVADLFEKLEVGKLAPQVYEVGDVRPGRFQPARSVLAGQVVRAVRNLVVDQQELSPQLLGKLPPAGEEELELEQVA